MTCWTISCRALIYVLVLACLVQAQIDFQLCPDGAITTLDPKWPNTSASFELYAELTSNDGTSDIMQALTIGRDIIIETADGETVMEYWYFDTNEQFTILNMNDKSQEVPPVCLRQVISPQAITSLIQSTVFLKPSVLLGYDARDERNPNFGAKLIGTSQIRQMPVNIFQSCFYVESLRQTMAVTYHMTNIDAFPSFGYVNVSVPLRIEVRTKPPTGGDERTYFYNIFEYLPELTTEQQQRVLSIPSSVYCSQQINTKPVPANFSTQFSTSGETTIISGTQFTALSFSVIYDQAFQFAQFKSLVEGGEEIVELHDFATGLIYQYQTSTRQCKVSTMNKNTTDAVFVPGQSQFLQMANPFHLFLLDDMDYQYIGSRECHNGITCYVWLGQKPVTNGSEFERREWYWAYQNSSQNGELWIPIRVIIQRLDDQNRMESLAEMDLYGFQTNPLTVVEIDSTIADCYRALGPKEAFSYGIFSFVIDNADQPPVHKYSNYLKIIVWNTLIQALQIRPIRLSDIFIDRNGADLIVTFTLVDNPPFYGPVANPLKEATLDTLVKKLQVLIDAKNISFVGMYNDSHGVRLYPKRGSLNVIARTPIITLTNNITLIVYETVTNTTKLTKEVSKERTNGSKITGFWIGFLAVGLVCGTVIILGGMKLIERIRK